MWIDADGVGHSVAGNTGQYALDPDLISRIVAASSVELREAAAELTDYPSIVFERLEDFATTPAAEEAFVGMELPASEYLRNLTSELNLTRAICAALDSAPLRWQAELCFSVIAAVGDELDRR